MSILATLSSGSLGPIGLAQQAQIAILKATTAIPGSSSADWSTATLAHTLDNPNPHGTSENDQFGSAVAMSSTHAIVGTYYESDANGTMAGKAYIYNIATGALLYTLDNPNPYDTSTNDRFGFSVAISDTYAIVGAFQEDEAGGNSSGKAYIYSLSDGSLIKTLSNRDPDASALGDLFGFSVAISDTYAIVGAWGEDWPYGGGAAYIYDISSLSSDGSVPLPTIIQNASTSTETNAYFGWAVALSDNYVIVSAPNAFSATGQAFVFNLSDGSLLYTFDNPNPNTNDGFGGDLNPAQSPTMLAISDNYAIVGTAVGNPASGDLSGKVYVFDLSDGSLAYTLDNPNAFGTTDWDRFGMTVDLDDDFVIVGAPYEDDAGGTTSGKAYIYNLTDGSLVRTLDDPNAFGTTDGDRFGHSVAINDGIAIVSASLEDDAGGTDSGKVYIFDAQVAAPAVSADWSNATLAYTLDNPNPYGTSASDTFGKAVAISGDYAIVGAVFEDDAAGVQSGKAYIYNVTTGVEVHTLNNPNPYSTSANDNFGNAVSISDTHAIVGAPGEDDASGEFSGKAYIYNVATGALVHTLNDPNPFGTSQYDFFGNAVSISDDYAIVSANGEGDSSGSWSGKAYIYNVTTGALVHTLDNPNPYGDSSGDSFASSVSISDNYAIVGALYEDDAVDNSSGKAYIYNVTTGALVHTLNNPNPDGIIGTNGDNFGFSVAISGDHAIVGAIREGDAGDNNSGKAYIFNVITGTLVHTLANPSAYGTSASDYFGSKVAIEGNYAIVGASSEDDAGDNNSGKAYIFDVTTGSLLYTLDNPNAYGTSDGDYFADWVAISGGRAIVGAVGEDEAGNTSSGKAYIFSAPITVASAPAEESTGWTIDLSNVTYDSVSFSVNQDNTPQSIAFNNDGTKMYMMGGFHKNIHQYTLSTGFDLSTALYDNVNFYMGSQDNNPMHMKFNTDGTKMYVNGLQRNKIHQYSLASGFNLSTTSYDNVTFELPAFTYGFTFNNDGTKMYSNGDAGNLRQYSLTTGFDISTASYDNVNFSASQSHSPNDMWFNSDGTKMYILFAGGEDDVHQYSLTTGFDISTASYDNVLFSVGGQENNPTGTAISSDGTKMYVIGGGNDTVYQYSTGL